MHERISVREKSIRTAAAKHNGVLLQSAQSFVKMNLKNIKVKVIGALDSNGIEVGQGPRGVIVIKTVNSNEIEAGRSPRDQVLVDVAIATKSVTICKPVSCVIHTFAAKICFGALSAQMLMSESVLSACVVSVSLVGKQEK